MARREPTVFEAKPRKPIRYDLPARLADRRAGRAAGKLGIPQLPAQPPEALKEPLTTPYLNALRKDLWERAEGERLQALRDVADVRVRRHALKAEIAELEERSNEIRKHLDALPVILDDRALERRNAVEQHADPELIRTRRQREHTARRERVQAAQRQADEELRVRRVELAQADETIAVRRRARDIRVGRLRAHADRRSEMYIWHLVRTHPDRHALTPHFDVSSSALPDWLLRWPADEDDTEI